jgi:hypothetical protein
MPTALEIEMLAFLNRYNEVFATFDGDRIAEFYVVPSHYYARRWVNTLFPVPRRDF